MTIIFVFLKIASVTVVAEWELYFVFMPLIVATAVPIVISVLYGYYKLAMLDADAKKPLILRLLVGMPAFLLMIYLIFLLIECEDDSTSTMTDVCSSHVLIRYAPFVLVA